MQNEISPEEIPLPATERSSLLERLQRKQKDRELEAKGNFIAFLFCLVFAFVVIISLPEQARNTSVSIMAGIALLWGVTRICIGFLISPVLTVEKVKQIESAESVGPLLDMMRSAQYSIDQSATLYALSQCLNRIKLASDAPLTERQRRQLLRHLQEYAFLPKPGVVGRDFCIAACKALEQIGDISAVPVVEKIAALNADTPNKRQIRKAARECLPLLKIRAGLVAETKILLRASAPERAGRDTLLRPAGASGATKPDELLRSSEPDAGC